MAHALEIPLYQLFYEGTEKPPVLKATDSESGWGSRGSDAKTLDRFRRLIRRKSTQDDIRRNDELSLLVDTSWFRHPLFGERR
jgi:hypothetical protein